MRDPDRTRYWFPAKTFGWGWGLPATWEGWLVLVGYVALHVVAAVALPPHRRPFGYGVAVTVMTAVLIAICWWTGEPPRWRWGRR